ncbi:hypothetical protein QYE76_048935 [Lolium multiflorum]|uniref:Reverse transcriptase domain-containing protein n=1 Tax=Lolium multiflorum TaxID=4521 RepID=A0AAD8WGD5_LOLMU|nr:hypothetical protein QYE76_048935 [Lolium multiflorum]
MSSLMEFLVVGSSAGAVYGKATPLYLFLFNIIVDVLQLMILQASREGLLLHPFVDDLTYHVIQYADDTLIVIRAIPQHVVNLKKILDDFSVATGLTINFHKSNFVPIKTTSAAALSMANSFGCAISSFPKTYLGLPLSTYKLRKKCLPTNERWFRHHLSTSAACPSCCQDEDTEQLLLQCPQARAEVWKYFYPEFDKQGPSNLADLWTSHCQSYATTTITTAIAWSI